MPCDPFQFACGHATEGENWVCFVCCLTPDVRNVIGATSVIDTKGMTPVNCLLNSVKCALAIKHISDAKLFCWCIYHHKTRNRRELEYHNDYFKFHTLSWSWNYECICIYIYIYIYILNQDLHDMRQILYQVTKSMAQWRLRQRYCDILQPSQPCTKPCTQTAT